MPPTADAKFTAHPPTVWLSYQWAHDWYDDALRAARETGRGPRRHEIVFSIAFAESYIFEFVLVQALVDVADQFREINEYFPPGEYRNVQDKWKVVPKDLHAKGRIAASPDLDGQDWEDFLTLVDYRNGLVHGRSSRPDTSELSEDLKPMPTTQFLDDLEPGWALQIVTRQVRALHAAANLELPAWLIS